MNVSCSHLLIRRTLPLKVDLISFRIQNSARDLQKKPAIIKFKDKTVVTFKA